MSFMSAPSILQKIILIGMLLTMILSTCDLFLCLRRKSNFYYYTIIEIIVFLISSFILVNLTVYSNKKVPEKFPWISFQVIKLPVWIFIFIEMTSLFLCVIIIIFGYKTNKSHVSKMSIKESFDNLPSGICFYEETGLLRLVNLKIDDLCIKITGNSLLNGVEFWKILVGDSSIAPNERVGTIDSPMIKTNDSNVYLFKRIIHEIDGKKIYEIVATNITKRYNLSKKLSKKNRELSALNKRLRAYGENINELIEKKETLNAKIRIHDELGKLLLVTRNNLSKEMSREEKYKLLSVWKNDLTAFFCSNSEKEFDTYSELYAAAKSVGVILKIIGKKPVEKKLKKILIITAIECVTNTVKHAKGKLVNIKIEDKKFLLKILVTNDGMPPKNKIKEGGGFSSLRLLVENDGGSMNINSYPTFQLEITIPKGD